MMTNADATREVWDKWLQVWGGRDDLLAECLGPRYTRHGSFTSSSFTVTYAPEEYAHVLTNERDRFKLRFTIGDLALAGDRIWARLTLYRTDPETSETTSRAAMQTYRVEHGRLVETWVTYHPWGTAWPDTSDPFAR